MSLKRVVIVLIVLETLNTLCATQWPTTALGEATLEGIYWCQLPDQSAEDHLKRADMLTRVGIIARGALLFGDYTMTDSTAWSATLGVNISHIGWHKQHDFTSSTDSVTQSVGVARGDYGWAGEFTAGILDIGGPLTWVISLSASLYIPATAGVVLVPIDL